MPNYARFNKLFAAVSMFLFEELYELKMLFVSYLCFFTQA